MAVADHDLDRAVGEPAGDVDRRPRVHHGIRHKLAGEQHGIVHEPVPVGGAGHHPGLQRVPHETPRRGGRFRFRLVRRAGDTNLRSHAPIVTDSGIVNLQFSHDARERGRGASSHCR